MIHVRTGITFIHNSFIVVTAARQLPRVKYAPSRVAASPFLRHSYTRATEVQMVVSSTARVADANRTAATVITIEQQLLYAPLDRNDNNSDYDVRARASQSAPNLVDFRSRIFCHRVSKWWYYHCGQDRERRGAKEDRRRFSRGRVPDSLTQNPNKPCRFESRGRSRFRLTYRWV